MEAWKNNLVIHNETVFRRYICMESYLCNITNNLRSYRFNLSSVYLRVFISKIWFIIEEFSKYTIVQHVDNSTVQNLFLTKLLCITAPYAIDRTVNYHLLFERSMSVLLPRFCGIVQIDGPFKWHRKTCNYFTSRPSASLMNDRERFFVSFISDIRLLSGNNS